jgi:hypothetical protein
MSRAKRLISAIVLGFAFSLCPLTLSVLHVPATVSAQKSVHVKGYTTKTGKVVEPYDRKAPKSKGSASSSTPSSSSTKTSTPSASSSKSNDTHPANYCDTCARDSKGRILRGGAARDAFKRETGFPKGRPGYVIDHIIPLACGGQDSTANMQWQTVEAAKAKDKTERKGCRAA